MPIECFSLLSTNDISQEHTVIIHFGRTSCNYFTQHFIIGSDNGLSPGCRQAIIWTNDGKLLIGSLRTNFSEFMIGMYTFSFKKIQLKMSSGKCWPFCLGLNVFILSFAIHFVEKYFRTWNTLRLIEPASWSSGIWLLIHVVTSVKTPLKLGHGWIIMV